MKAKRVTALLLASAMVLSMTSGVQAADEPVELEFWGQGTGTDDDTYYLAGVIDEFNAEYEGKIKVNRVALGGDSDGQAQKFQMAASADRMPDIAEMNTGKALKEYVEAGVLCNMNDYLGDDEFISRFTSDALELGGCAGYSEDSLYAFGTETEIQGWHYNKALFDEYELEIPETWDELLNCVAVFKENGITPIAHGGLDQWPLWGYWAWFSRLGFTEEANYWDEFANGNIKVADCEPLRKVFDYMVELQQAGAFPENITTMSNTQAYELFVGGAAAMYACGSWKLAGMEECEIADDIVFNWGPEFEDGALDSACGMRPYSWCLAFGSGLDDDPAKKEAAATFARWLTSPECTKIEVEEYGHIPAAAVDAETTSLGTVGKMTMEAAMDDSIISVIDPNSWCAYEGSTTVIWNAMTSILSGTIGTDEALSQIQNWIDRL